jgi:multiple sugar transport system substrate-binding protein
MNSKHFITIITMVLIIALSACTPVASPTAVVTTIPNGTAQPIMTTSTPASPNATNTSAPSATPPLPGITAAPNALKIQFWHVFGTMQGVAMQKLADKFNAANPSIFIIPTQQGSSYEPLHQKMNTAITTNSYPDLIWGYPADLADYYNAGVLVPLDTYISDPKDGLSSAQLADINTSLYFSKYDGKTIGVASAVMEQVMYYNADMLKAAGFDQPPTTWDEFDKVCAAVSKPPDTYCYSFIPSASTFAAWIWSRAGNYATSDEKAAAFNSPEGINTLEWLKNLANQHWAYQPASAYGDTTDFANGKVAFTFSSSSGLPYYSSAVSGSQHPFKWSIAPFPAGPNGRQVVDSFNTSMGILKTTPEKQKAAWLWIKFMLGKDGGTDWALATAYFPTSKSTLDALNSMDEATAQSANPSFATVLSQYKLATQFSTLGVAEPVSPAWSGVKTIIQNMLVAVFTGKSGPDFQATDPTTAAAEGAQRVNDALSQYGK